LNNEIEQCLKIIFQSSIKILYCAQSFSTAGCKSDSECPLSQACINRECQNPCPFEQCGTNADCNVRNHRPKCTCRPGYKGNPYENCRQYECLSDPDCSTTLTCRNEKCVDPCECAQFAECTPRNHRGICTCSPDYTGNPYGIACKPSKNISFCYSLMIVLLS
jgi:hypothetical protein